MPRRRIIAGIEVTENIRFQGGLLIGLALPQWQYSRQPHASRETEPPDKLRCLAFPQSHRPWLSAGQKLLTIWGASASVRMSRVRFVVVVMKPSLMP